MNDNVSDATLDDPLADYPWLSGKPAVEARAVVKRAIRAHLDISDHDMSALPEWILEDLAHAGLEIVRRER